MDNKLKYDTIQEYLELYLYPSLQLAVNGLLNEIRKEEFYRELENEFNQYFFENKAKIIKKEKEMLKLERGSDYSESDYDFLMRKQIAMSESLTESQNVEEEEEFDPDLDDSEMINLAEQELNKEDEPPEKKFNPIDYIAGYLKSNNLLKNKPQDFDEVVIEKEYDG